MPNAWKAEKVYHHTIKTDLRSIFYVFFMTYYRSCTSS